MHVFLTYNISCNKQDIGVVFRTARFDWKSSGSRARLIGSLISFAGAISLTLYKGPTVRSHSSPSFFLQAAAPPRLLVFSSPHENWALGCILFAASSLTLVIWNVFQVQIKIQAHTHIYVYNINTK